MDFNVLFDKIGLWKIGRERFWSIHSHCEEEEFMARLNKSFEDYDKGDEFFAESVREFAAWANVPVETMILYVYVRLSERTLEDYKKRGFPEEVFYESMRDLEVDSRYNYEKTGVYGISETPHRKWIRRHLASTIFRFGRLQYELYKSPYNAEVDGAVLKEGDTCLSVHIPRYAPLDDAACEESYDRARAFFKTYFGMDPCIFLCSSWLIHPWMSETMDDSSRIVRFQKKYKVIKLTENSNSPLGQVFPEKKENIDDYPEDTGLRRAAKARLKSGLPMGTAVGIRL